MKPPVYAITNRYFSCENVNEYIVCGMWPVEGIAEAYIDDVPLQIKCVKKERIGFFEQSQNRDLIWNYKVTVSMEMPENIHDYQRLTVYAVIRGRKTVWLSLKIEELFDENSTDKMVSAFEKVYKKIERYSAKIVNRIKAHKESDKSLYQKWFEMQVLTKEQILSQKKWDVGHMPMLSVIVTNNTISEACKKQVIEKLHRQTYSKWEVLYPDESSVLTLEKQIKDAQGDYILFWNVKDDLSQDALFEIAFAVTQESWIDILYGDDCQYTDNNLFENTRLKPDYNLELLRSENYIGRFFAVKKEIAERVGGFDYGLDEYKEYDYLLRCAELTDAIYHIPRILNHLQKREYVNESAERVALQAHYNRMNLPVIVEKGLAEGVHRSVYKWNAEPLISIIIPNKDHIDDLKRCIDSIENKSVYRNYEYIIVENNSKEESTFAFYEQLKQENPKVKVVTWEGSFNYSAINNYGIRHASGEYYLLLNNDTAIINKNCLRELLGYCMRDDVGAVGARLYYEDDTIQHAGVIVGMGGIAGHAFTHEKKEAVGYMNRIVCCQEYSALTAACLMVKREVYHQVGGLSEELAVAFNDIDLCLKIREAGYRIIYNPYAELYHFESKSRGGEDTPEKVARFHGEIRTFENRWKDILLNGDPHYNRNLTLDYEPFTIRRC